MNNIDGSIHFYLAAVNKNATIIKCSILIILKQYIACQDQISSKCENIDFAKIMKIKYQNENREREHDVKSNRKEYYGKSVL